MTIGVDENIAFNPVVQRAAELIAVEAVGKVLHIDGYFSLVLRLGTCPE